MGSIFDIARSLTGDQFDPTDLRYAHGDKSQELVHTIATIIEESPTNRKQLAEDFLHAIMVAKNHRDGLDAVERFLNDRYDHYVRK